MEIFPSMLTGHLDLRGDTMIVSLPFAQNMSDNGNTSGDLGKKCKTKENSLAETRHN